MLGKEAARLELVGGPAPPSSPAARSTGAAARRSPFSPRPLGARFFFETEALRAALERAMQVLSGDGPALLVEGEAGAGKTSFLQRLGRSGLRTDTCLIEARQPLGEDQLHVRVAEAFGLGDARDVDELAAQLAGRCAGGSTPLVIVDDGHRLTPFGLRALLDLRRSVMRRGGRIGVAVSAPHRALERALSLPSFSSYGEAAFSRLELPAFGEEETGEYLRLAIEAAGLQQEVAFDTAQVAALHKASCGLPGQIDRLADEVLRGARPRPYRRRVADRQGGRARTRRGGIAWPAAVLGLVLGSTVYLGYAVFMSPPGIGDSPGLAGAAEFLGEQEVVPPPPALETVPDDAPTAPPEPPQAPAVAAPVPAPSAAVLQGPVVRSTPPSSPSAQAPPLNDHAWLMAQDPGRFTIQLASTPDHERAMDFIEKHPLQGRTVAIETLRGTRTWYVVLHNSYGSSAEAQRAIEGLPSSLRRNDPFARRVESVKAIMSGR